MDKSKVRLQKRNLDRLVRNGGFKLTKTFFPYASGEIGPFYVNSEVVMRNPTDYFRACEDMTNLIRDEQIEELGVISGGEKRDWIFSIPVSLFLYLSPTMICKNGTIYGADMNGKLVAHVADLNNEGSSVRDLWVPAIKKAGGRIKQVFFYVDRLEDGTKVVQDLGLESHAVVPLDANAWEYLQKQGVVSREIYQTLMKRMEDKDAWARAMLRSEAGFEKLVQLVLDPTTKQKAVEIWKKGYPDMKEELVDKLFLKRGIKANLF